MRTTPATPPSKARLLDAAERLMLAKGFEATTVDEICGAAKLTKGGFFHYFHSKEDLGRQLLERFCASGSRMHEGFCGAERD
ncbi:MAG: TetR/AcrR family transcriptional regulator, partial [bacterium]